MDLLYPLLRMAVGWGAGFSFIPVVGFTAIGIIFNAIRHSRVPRAVNVILTVVALAVAAYGVQPFLRTWYKYQDERVELELLYQKLCVDPTGCKERLAGQCVQYKLDLQQWPLTLAFTECMDKLFKWFMSLQGLFALGVFGIFLLGLCTVLVGGSALQRRSHQQYHIKRDTELRALASGTPPERVR